MKVLYAIQGTGNGHLSRARDIIPVLKDQNIKLDLLVSGTQAEVVLPYDVKYNFKGLSFIFGAKGGVDLWKTYRKANSNRLRKEIKSLPIKSYDLVINDFEPVSAWAAKLKNQRCVSLSHQAAVLEKNSPKPETKDKFGAFILKRYAPSDQQYGLHFESYDKNIFTPIIRSEIRFAKVKKKDHYTVYLPSYSDEKILNVLSKVKGVKWEVFSKHNTKEIQEKNIIIRPIHNELFIKSMTTSTGVLCGAGFETPAEALYLRKKLMVIPMKNQFEQQCNAAALCKMGVPVIKSLKKKQLESIQNWVDSDKLVEVNYDNQTEQIVQQLLDESVSL